MHTYDANDYRYLLAGSEEIINQGKERTRHLFEGKDIIHDNLLFQIGEAQGERLESLLRYAITINS